MKFSEMQYARPDIDDIKRQMTELTNRLSGADDYAGAKEAFVAFDALERHVDDAATIVSVRHSIDTRDAFYKEEQDFYDQTGPELQSYTDAFTKALLDSPFREDFVRDYGDIIFINGELRRKAFSPEIISELQEENSVVQAYETLLAKAMVPFEGKEYTLSQMTAFKTDADDARRLAAWKAEGQWYADHGEELDELYTRLVTLRDTIGKKLGNKDYVKTGYARMQRNCYTKEDIEVFREAVVQYLVPVADEIYKEQAKRIGVSYPLSFADTALTFRSGNPRPKGGADDVLAAGTRFYDALSKETSEFWHMMLDEELLDVLSREGKRGGGYMTEFPKAGVPFIFANFNGTQGDVEVVTHEAGHAFAAYMNFQRVPFETVLPSMEGAEVHSMSMEFFAEKNAEDFFGEDARKYCYSHLADAITFIPYGTMVDHFQHIMYENPGMKPEERHAEWKRLIGIYMPWLKLDGEIPFYAEGKAWQRQHHIYSLPFYYIDYCLAQTVALSFWARIQEDVQDAWEHYMAYTKLGGSMPFTSLLKTAGLDSPFEKDTLRNVCEKAHRYLTSYDLTGIA